MTGRCVRNSPSPKSGETQRLCGWLSPGSPRH